MRIRVPEYYHRFQCLAGDCPHSCCERWQVVIDDVHVRQYARLSGALGDRLRQEMQTEDGEVCFPLNGGRCPFLDHRNLCEIHRELGKEATSMTCQEHPRFTEDYGAFREISLSASCPAANGLLLGSQDPLTFREWETAEPEEEGDEWLCWLLPLREKLLSVLQNRNEPLTLRLGQFLRLSAQAQDCLDSDDLASLGNLRPTEDPTEIPVLPEDIWASLAQLEGLDPQWAVLLQKAESVSQTAVSQDLLERIAVYFAFRYLLKTVNDGELLARAGFCVLAVLVIERLAMVCGLPEALRHFSCEIEHHEDNLQRLTFGVIE